MAKCNLGYTTFVEKAMVADGQALMYVTLKLVRLNISQGHRVLRQLRGVSLVVVDVALFVPTVCPVGGGYVGYIWKALEKGYSEHPGSACCTDSMFEIFVRFGRHVCFPLPLFVDRQLPCLHTNSLHALLLPLMHHKSLWCAKGLALGVQSGCGSLEMLPSRPRNLV